MSLFAAGLFRNNPNAPWWENLLVSAVCFAVLALFMELARRFGPTQKASVNADEKTREPVVPIATGLAEKKGNGLFCTGNGGERGREKAGLSAEHATPGIGGWLILLAIGLLTGPFLTAYSVIQNLALFGASMAADFQAVLMLETLVLSGMVLFQTYVATAFFRRRASAPNLVIALFIARVVFIVIDLIAVASVTRESPGAGAVGGLIGSLIAAGIWIPYLLLSQRVKATFVFGGTIGNGISRPLSDEANRDLAFVAPSAPQRPESDQGTGHVDPRRDQGPATDERIAALPVAATVAASGAEWRVIHAGKELGPFSAAELAAQADDGEIEADDLVKSPGGLWTKAREFAFLQQQFVLRDSREEARRQAINRRDRFHGIWLSKDNLAMIGGGVLLVLLLGFAVWFSRRSAILPMADAPSKDAVFYFNRGNSSLFPIINGVPKDYDSAIKDYTEAIRLDPNYAMAFFNRAYAWDAKKEYDIAIKDYTEAIRLNPKDAGAYHNRGIAWGAKKEYDKAIRDYDEAIRLNPKNGDAYHNRGNALLALGGNTNAIEDYTEAIRLNPNNGNAYHGRGIVWSNKMDYDRAIKDYTEAIRLNPSNGDAYRARGIAWSDKKDHDSAIKDYTEVIRLNPRDADAFVRRGFQWSQKHDFARATKDFDEARRLDPNILLGFPL